MGMASDSAAGSARRASTWVAAAGSLAAALILAALIPAAAGLAPAAAAAAAGEAPPSGAAPTAAGQAADTLSAAVYAALIDQHYNTGAPGPLLILGESVNRPDDAVIDEHFRLRLQAALDPLSAETVAAFEQLQEVRAAVPSEVPSHRAVQILARTVRDSLFSVCPGGWPRFANKYPGARGYVTLSPVAFDPDKSEALVYTEEYCGFGCSQGTYAYLKRIGSRWKVMKKLTAWVS
jgi:hypothetical protein